MAFKYGYTIQIGVLNTCVIRTCSSRIGPYLIDPCVLITFPANHVDGKNGGRVFICYLIEFATLTSSSRVNHVWNRHVTMCTYI